MTQNQLKILTLLSISTFIFVIFDFVTILTFSLSAFLTHRLLKIILSKHLQRGLIDHLPQTIQNNLLNKSMLDLMTQIWYYQIFKFIKLLFKPLLYPVDHQNSSLEVLQEFKSINDDNVYLTKGIIKMLPNSCQKILLGHQRLKKMKEQDNNAQKLYQKQLNSERNTDDESQKQNYKLITRYSSEKQRQIAINHHQIQDDRHEEIIERQIKFDEYKIRDFKEQKLDKKKSLSTNKKSSKNIIQIVQDSIGMIKKLIQLQNVPGKILKINTLTIVKLMIVFWIIMLVQIKYNKNGRQIVIKILHILGGIISVFGVVGTTGMLIYKSYSKDQNKKLQN